MMDLTAFLRPEISYSLWFVNTGGNSTPNDDVRTRITNGVDTVDIEIVTSDQSFGIWRPTFSFFPGDLMDLTANMQFIVEASDFDPGHLVEAGLDQFLVTETSTSTRDLVAGQIFSASPNPFNERTILNFDEAVTGQLVVTNVIGQQIEMISLQSTNQIELGAQYDACLLYTSPSPRDRTRSRMPSSA